MNRLLVDIGNTRVKWALARAADFIEQNRFVWELGAMQRLLDCQWGQLDRPESIAISNVAGDVIEEAVTDWCRKNWSINPDIAVVSRKACGVTNSYSQPQQLGIDRWLAILGGWSMVKGSVCVIDCGSAVTIDVLDANGVHQGGLIAPGLSLSARALTDHTHALNAEVRKNFPMLASSTEDAINSGCYHQFIGGIQYMIGRIRQQFGSSIQFIITGGDAEQVIHAIDDELISEPDLVLKGLMLIK